MSPKRQSKHTHKMVNINPNQRRHQQVARRIDHTQAGAPFVRSLNHVHEQKKKKKKRERENTKSNKAISHTRDSLTQVFSFFFFFNLTSPQEEIKRGEPN
jgi:hypothetical protein